MYLNEADQDNAEMAQIMEVYSAQPPKCLSEIEQTELTLIRSYYPARKPNKEVGVYLGQSERLFSGRFCTIVASMGQAWLFNGGSGYECCMIPEKDIKALLALGVNRE
jgi:hypothetical protein